MNEAGSIGPRAGGAGPTGAAIEAALAWSSGLPVRLASGPEPLLGGLSATLVTFRLLDPPPGWARDLVLRAPSHDTTATREFVVQREVAEAGFPAPAVLAMDAGADNPLGRPYLVMARAPGTPMFSDAGPIEVFRGFRRVPGELARLMAELHALDASPIETTLRAAGVEPEQLGADGAPRRSPRRRYLSATGPGDPRRVARRAPTPADAPGGLPR